MGLREQAERDLGFILEDDKRGFGWPITLIAPNDVQARLIGFSDDISQIIDPDTGQIVSGRVASVSLRTSTILCAMPTSGFPRAIADETKKPWRVKFDDLCGQEYLFKVMASDPDRTLGLVVCMLEIYEK